MKQQLVEPLSETTGDFPRAAPAPPVGMHAVTGAAWTVGMATANKVLTVIGQIVLAWFLVPDDFGLIAMACSFTAIGNLLTLGGLSDVLVQRHSRFREDAPQVFWLSLSASTFGAAAVALISPLGGAIFHDARVVPFIVIEALCWPCDGAMTVYVARLKQELRFKPLALVCLLMGMAHTGTAAVLAWRGCGAYALAFAPVARRLTGVLGMRLAAGRIPLGKPHLREWPALLGPAAWLMLTGLFAAIYSNVASFVLGIHCGPTQAGLYAWGLGLASQAAYLLSANLQQVLFPALARLTQESERQFAAFRQSIMTILAALAPLCVLQMVTAYPALDLVFHDRWLQAAAVVSWLSFGMLTQPIVIVSSALLMARGRYGFVALLGAIQAAAVATAAILGAHEGSAALVARNVACAMFISGLLYGWAAFSEYGQGILALATTIARPFLCVALSGLAGWAALRPVSAHSPAVQLGATIVVFGCVYSILAYTFMIRLVSELRSRL
ncbi:MAG: oligosaccharide flippase family protein [Planctomycetota bacterium]|nr:oligosaccharide flippase family protein [Planctomycetota bacterium]